MDRRPHVLMLPFPAQGHLKPLLNLAKFLCDAGFHVTFVNSDHNHRFLTNLPALSTRFPTLHFEPISYGLPKDYPRENIANLPELRSSVKKVMKPLFGDLLINFSRRSHELPITCIIADVATSFAIDFAKELGIPIFMFQVFGAASLWSFFCLPKLVEEGQLPVEGDENMAKILTGVPGMEGLLRCRDLNHVCRRRSDDPNYNLFINEIQAICTTSGLIIHTFEDLEAFVLSHMAPLFSKTYAIGPLNALFRSRIGDDDFQSISSSGHLWEADRSCMTWLDSQPSKSVVYVSFGSLAMRTCDQLKELWHGLVNSGKPFLLVIRPDSIVGADGDYDIPVELKEGTKERGFLVDWAPQEDVLGHQAVGAYFTHCGWNSTLEAIVAGVPMICLSQYVDQHITSTLVTEVWKIGLDLKETCDRSAIEKVIRTLMDDKREEFIASVGKIAKLANKCVSQGGSSYKNLDKLIEDIRKI